MFINRFQTTLLAALAFLSAPVYALQCELMVENPPTLNYASLANQAASQSISLAVSCRAPASEGLHGRDVTVCLGLGTGTSGAEAGYRLMRHVESQVNLFTDIYTDAAHNRIWGGLSSSSHGHSVPQLRVRLSPMLNGLLSGQAQTRVYWQIPADQTQAQTGRYESYFAGSDVEISYEFSRYKANCQAPYTTVESKQTSFQIAAIVPSQCGVRSVDNLVFPDSGNLKVPIEASSAFVLQCAPGTSYKIAINDGLNPGQNKQRQLKNLQAPEQLIRYQLYQDAARTRIWSSHSGNGVLAATANGQQQAHTIYARTESQTTPIAGTYQDQLVLTVEF